MVFTYLNTNLTDDPRCVSCGGQEETLLHLLRDCPYSRSIWHLVGGIARSEDFFKDDLQPWILKNLKADHVREHTKWPSSFGVTIWWIWRWRNKTTFNQPEDIPTDVFSFLLLKFEEHLRAFHLIGPATAPVRGLARETFIQWRAPPHNWLALNTDGAAKGSPGAAGGGGIIRDGNGKFVHAFSANYGCCTAYKAEMKAILHGLQLAQSLGIRNLLVQVDNQAYVQVLNDYKYQGGECFNIVNQSRTIIRNFGDNISIIHVYRKSNRVADLLANMGTTQTEAMIYWDKATTQMAPLLHEDFAGYAIPRVIRN